MPCPFLISCGLQGVMMTHDDLCLKVVLAHAFALLLLPALLKGIGLIDPVGLDKPCTKRNHALWKGCVRLCIKVPGTDESFEYTEYLKN